MVMLVCILIFNPWRYSDLDNLQSATFVGLMVRWNLTGEGTKAMLYARNIGNMKITDLNGGNGYSAVITCL
jgi:hypothetical protein